MSVLVTGGAGYVGSHMTLALLDKGEKVIALDNISTGVRSLVSEHAIFVEGDVGNATLIRQLLAEHAVDAVIHFAGLSVVPESVATPLVYYANNTAASRALIEACVENGVKHFVFSSTASVYGAPAKESVDENTATEPVNPYGRSKLMTEWILEDTSKANPDFRHVSLRYFNVAGADASGRTGQSTPGATHLIKRACQVALGRLPHLDIFGVDYATPDGTGVRDYIHVVDLVSAHLLALQALRNGAGSTCYNCGYGRGFSVRQVVAELEAITGRVLPVHIMPRRAGDIAKIVSNPGKLKRELNWHPAHDDLREILSSTLAWERRLGAPAPDGRVS